MKHAVREVIKKKDVELKPDANIHEILHHVCQDLEVEMLNLGSLAKAFNRIGNTAVAEELASTHEVIKNATLMLREASAQNAYASVVDADRNTKTMFNALLAGVVIGGGKDIPIKPFEVE